MGKVVSRSGGEVGEKERVGDELPDCDDVHRDGRDHEPKEIRPVWGAPKSLVPCFDQVGLLFAGSAADHLIVGGELKPKTRSARAVAVAGRSQCHLNLHLSLGTHHGTHTD